MPPRRRLGPVDDDPVARLGMTLQQLRGQTGKSLKELESEVHVSDSSLSRYFSGRAVPPWSVVERLSKLAGQDPERLCLLWEGANRTHRAPTNAVGKSSEEPATGEPSVARPLSWRVRRRRPLLVAAFVTTAVVFAASGFLAGRQFGVHVVTLKPTEDQACVSWPWPANTGETIEQPVLPRARDHTPTVQLVEGKATDGRSAVWAEMTGSSFGDHVWLDWSTDLSKTWVQCGPFPVTSDSGTSRAHDLVPGSLFRACGDIPQALAVPGERSEICTVPNPWLSIETMITRRNPDPAFPGVLAADQALDLPTALAAHTVNPARAMGLHQETGRIEPGLSAIRLTIVGRSVHAAQNNARSNQVTRTGFEGAP